MCQAEEAASGIEKRYIVAMSTFAIKHIPGTDPVTLEKFIELISVGGTHGSLSDKQLVEKMRIMVKYVPDTNLHSLLTLIELMDIYLPLQVKDGGEGVGLSLPDPHPQDQCS
jgi:hypothetical protein